MSRRIRRRWELTGTLVAVSPVHVGTLDDGPHLTQARDGLGNPLLPGTSLAGVIKAALPEMSGPEERLWGWPSKEWIRDDNKTRAQDPGAASYVRIDDAVALPPATDTGSARQPATEVREHVAIDRVHGVAAPNFLYTREVLPAGTRFAFRLVLDDPDDGDADPGRDAGSHGDSGAGAGVDAETVYPARSLIEKVAALLRGPGVSVGAATTRGLGRVRLHDATLRRHDLATRAGMLALLAGKSTEVKLPAPTKEDPAPGMLRVVIPWRPHGPLMAQVAADGDVVDAFPLTTVHNGRVRLELGGSTIKGVFRSHAERIVRTVLGIDAPPDFLDQMRADGLGPVGALFGRAGDHKSVDLPGRRGALRAYPCLSNTGLPPKLWQQVRLLQQRSGSSGKGSGRSPGGNKREPSVADERRDALRRLQQAIDDLNKNSDGIEFVIAPHVAVDRWTGGAAEARLFAVLEPHVTRDDAWEPMVLDIDMRWLATDPGWGAAARNGDKDDDAAKERAAEERRCTAVALLLLVLRDLAEGWIGFGHGTTRGMGAVDVRAEAVRFLAGPESGELATKLRGRSLAELFDDDEIITRLMAAWPPERSEAATLAATGEAS